MVKIKAPDGTEFELREGQALAQKEDGSYEVVTVREHEGATRKVSEDYKQMFGEIQAAAKEGRVEREKMTAALEDLTATLKEMPRNDPALEPDADPATIRSMDELMDMQVPDDEPEFDWVRRVQREASKCYIDNWVRTVQRRAGVGRGSFSPVESDAYRKFRRYADVVMPDRVNRATIWTPAGSTAGAEWVPTGIAAEYTLAHRLMDDITAMFKSITVPNGVKALQYPCTTSTSVATVRTIPSAGTNPIKAVDNTATAGNPTTGVLDLTPVELETPYYVVDMTEEEDASVSVIQALVEEARTCLTQSWSAAIVNGQTTDQATFDAALATGLAAAGNGYAAAAANYGVRDYAIYYLADQNSDYSVQSGGGVALTPDVVYSAWKKMGNFGMDIGKRGAGQGIALFLPPKAFFDLMTHDDLAKFINFGPQASLPSGAISQFMGINIVPCASIPLTHTDGIINATSANNTQWSAFLCNLSRWRVGVKKNAEVRLIDSPGERAMNIRGFARHGIGYYPPATDTHTVAIVDIAP